jgi:HSP20 family protein
MDPNNNSEMNRKPSTALSKLPTPIAVRVTPVADIFETDAAFVVKLDMPGATRETVDVTVEAGSLRAKGEVVSLHREGAAYVLNEIVQKVYFREFTLGAGASHENIQALFESGVLTITVPKTDDVKPTTIQIR